MLVWRARGLAEVREREANSQYSELRGQCRPSKPDNGNLIRGMLSRQTTHVGCYTNVLYGVELPASHFLTKDVIIDLIVDYYTIRTLNFSNFGCFLPFEKHETHQQKALSIKTPHPI